MTEEKIPTLEGSIADVNSAVAEITKMDTVIAELTEKYAKFVPMVDTPANMKATKEVRQKIREPRYLIEHLRKEAKAPIVAAGKQIDSRAAEMKDKLLAIEDPIHEAIKNEEDRKEREKQEAIAKEAMRVENIQARISSMRSIVDQCLYERAGLDRLQENIKSLESVNINDTFEEFQDRAQDAKDATLRKLHELKAEAIERAEMEAKAAEQQAEIDALRAEKAAREEEERKAEEAKQAERDRVARIEKRLEHMETTANSSIAIGSVERLEKAIAALGSLDIKTEEFEELQPQAVELRTTLIDRMKSALDKEQEREKAIRELNEAAEREAEAKNKRAKQAAEAKKAEYPGRDKLISGIAAHFDVTKVVARKWIDHLAASTGA